MVAPGAQTSRWWTRFGKHFTAIKIIAGVLGWGHGGLGSSRPTMRLEIVANKQISQKFRTICTGVDMDKCCPAASAPVGKGCRGDAGVLRKLSMTRTLDATVEA